MDAFNSKSTGVVGFIEQHLRRLALWLVILVFAETRARQVVPFSYFTLG